MGYDFHITRRASWADEGNDIAPEEWLQYVRSQSDLRPDTERGPHFALWLGPTSQTEPWLDWSDGQIYTKNPSPELIDRMVAAARHFGAAVQGDDGEIYENGSTPPRQPDVPLKTKISAFLRRLLPTKPLKIDHRPLPFAIGDRVREGVGGREATVIEIDPSALGGMGVIRVRRDDGSEIGWAMMTHDLTPIPDKKPV